MSARLASQRLVIVQYGVGARDNKRVRLHLTITDKLSNSVEVGEQNEFSATNIG